MINDSPEGVSVLIYTMKRSEKESLCATLVFISILFLTYTRKKNR
jgi:hypothetical protein